MSRLRTTIHEVSGSRDWVTFPNVGRNDISPHFPIVRDTARFPREARRSLMIKSSPALLAEISRKALAMSFRCSGRSFREG